MAELGGVPEVWPAFHPHGSGSVLSEAGAGSLKAHGRNRAASIQSWFRRTALWAFWFLDRRRREETCYLLLRGPRARFLFVPSTGIIKNDLFNINSRRRRRGRPASANDDPDGFTRNFGSAVPQNIPESRRLFIRVARLCRFWWVVLWMFTYS